MISGNVPNHLVAGARSGFLRAVRERPFQRQSIAMEIPMDGKTIDLVDLGSAPMPKNSPTGATIQDMIERHLEMTPKDWDITVWISHNAVEDDRIGNLWTRVQQAGQNFQKHMDKLAFQALNAGDGSTYGLCYDGQYFFDTDHVDAGALYDTDQSNVGSATLSFETFNTAMTSAMQFVDDMGEYNEFVYNLLVTSPALANQAAQLTRNPNEYDSADRNINPWAGQLTGIINPNMDSTAWVLVASSEIVKPIIIGMREQPSLQHAWFDPTAPDGGRYYFKFFARYTVGYGDWRLAYMGNS